MTRKQHKKCKVCGRELEAKLSIERDHGINCYIAMLERENSILKSQNKLLKALIDKFKANKKRR